MVGDDDEVVLLAVSREAIDSEIIDVDSHLAPHHDEHLREAQTVAGPRFEDLVRRTGETGAVRHAEALLAQQTAQEEAHPLPGFGMPRHVLLDPGVHLLGERQGLHHLVRVQPAIGDRGAQRDLSRHANLRRG